MKILGKKSLSSVVMIFLCVLLVLCIIAIVAGGIFVLSNLAFFTKDLLSITEEGILLKNVEIINDEEMDIWANLSIENADLSNFEDRIKMIKNTVSIAMKNNIKGINIIVTNTDKNLERFIIELAPILKEVGIVINIVDEGNIDEEIYTDIVNYIITRE